MLRLQSYRLRVADLAALTLVLSPCLWGGLPRAAAQTPGDDGGWPKIYSLSNGGSAALYQPQIQSWENRQHVVFWCAVGYTPPGAQKATLGTIKAEADTQVALLLRLVSFTNIHIDEFNFPKLSRSQSGAFVAAFEKVIPPAGVTIALDRVMAYLDKSQIQPQRGDDTSLRAVPPPIFTSTRPAILVMFESDPIWTDVQGLDLKYAVNTNWDVFQQVSTGMFFLRDNTSWLQASQVHGPWKPAGSLPSDFNRLPDNDNWKATKASIPGQSFPTNAVPTVFVSYKPAEMILLHGSPQYQPVSGTSLLWVNNTSSNLFRLGQSGPFYYLVAGRWFSAPSLNGPWTFTTPNLPADFKKIPLDFPRSSVLASVPGTDQAKEAVLLAQVPQTATVNMDLKPPAVIYTGDPDFQPIADTSMSYAVNTDKEIIKVGDLYYMCFQGVWFMASNANGPWTVTTSVPQSIYTIPASSPVYNVTYVTTQPDPNNSNVALCAFTAGFLGAMVGWGCCVWGSGWNYPPYYGGGGYFPYAATYGCGAYYNPYTGTYGRGGSAYGPYGGVSAGARYNPATGTYSRGASAYGPYGSRSFAQAYNPRTGTYAQTRQGSNVYGSWGSSSVQRGDQWAQTGHYTNNMTGRTTSVARSSSGNVYAGHDGNVYRNTGGSWQKYGSGGWSDMQKPTRSSFNSSTFSQLNNDWASRSDGDQRMNAMNSYHASDNRWASAGSFRSSGGGFGDRFGGDRFGGGGFGGDRFGGGGFGGFRGRR
jgi:hypothetical protein